MRAVLAPHLVDGVDAPASYSVLIRLAGGTDQRHRELHVLYRSSLAVVRSRSPRRVLQGLCSYLSGHVEKERAGLVRLAGMPVVGGDGAVVAPWVLRHQRPQLEARLRRLGLRVVDVPFVSIYPRTGELVVPSPALELASEVLDLLEPSEPPASPEPPPVPAGRYRIRGWGIPGRGPEPLSRAAAVAAVMTGRIDSAHLGGQDLLDVLAHVFEHAQPIPLSGDLPGFVSEIARIIASPRR